MNRATVLTGLAASMLLSLPVHAKSVSEQQQWTETYPVTAENAMLVIDNIWGDVKVRNGAANQIVVAVKELRSAPDQRLFERSQEVLKLHIDASTEGLLMQVGTRDNRWRQQPPCRNCRAEFEFDIQVPAGTSMNVSTVNDGKVEVSGVSGRITASNVNGPIHVSGMHFCEAFSNVNGVIELSFDSEPLSDCDIQTINGDITLNLPASSGLNLALDYANGRIVSEFPVDPRSIPAQVEHIQKDGLNRYLIQQLAGLSLAGGGPTFSISTLNGDIQIRKSHERN